MDYEGATERSGDAIQRILLALTAMAGLLAAAGFCLPRDIHRALIGPLRAAQDAARWLEADPCDPVAAARLLRRFKALARAIQALLRRHIQPVPGFRAEPPRAADRPPLVGPCHAHTIGYPDTS